MTGIVESVNRQSETDEDVQPVQEEKQREELDGILPSPNNQAVDQELSDPMANAFQISTKQNVKRIYLNQNLDFDQVNETLKKPKFFKSFETNVIRKRNFP